MISKPYFHDYHVAELIQFLNSIVNICENHDPEALHILPQVNAVANANKELKIANAVARKSSFTSSIENIDLLRDKCIIGIKLCAEAFIYHFKPEKSTAAKYIFESIDRHGKSIAKQNYPAETAILNKIFSNWTTDPKLIAALETLGINDWAIELKRLNDLFFNKNRLRNNEIASLPDKDCLEKGKIAIAAYRKLISVIEAHITLSVDNSYDKMVNKFNVIIKKYNIIVSRRKKKDDEDKPPKSS